MSSPETPQQFKERTGRELPDDTVVWTFSAMNPHWEYMPWWLAKMQEKAVYIIADCNGKPDRDYPCNDVAQ